VAAEPLAPAEIRTVAGTVVADTGVAAEDAEGIELGHCAAKILRGAERPCSIKNYPRRSTRPRSCRAGLAWEWRGHLGYVGCQGWVSATG
jgi:hypothetical protein